MKQSSPGGHNDLPMTRELININGHNINVVSRGHPESPPIVLLHHGLGCVQSWKLQVKELAAAGYRAITFDRWGYGCSDPRDELSVPYFEDDIDDLLVLLDTLNLERTILIGHSDGATIALYLAASHPQRVRALIVSAAHIYIEEKMKPGIEGIREAYEKDDNFKRGMDRVHGENADKVFRNWYNGWVKEENRSWDMRPSLEQIKCPTMVVQGIEDEHATPQHARDIASTVPGSKLWLQPAAGHMLPQECSHEFNKRILLFLDGL